MFLKGIWQNCEPAPISKSLRILKAACRDNFWWIFHLFRDEKMANSDGTTGNTRKIVHMYLHVGIPLDKLLAGIFVANILTNYFLKYIFARYF